LIATGLSEILNVDYDKIIEKTKDTSSWYKTIRTKIESDLADEVRAFITENDLKSIHLEPDTKRYYPYSSLACHILGFVGTDNYGLQGLEAVYDDYLTGVNGRIIRMKNGEGTNMLFTNFEDYYDAEDGDNITLTLDVTIQYYAEKYLNQAIEDYDVQNGGSCIIMNVNTGEILAMASRTSYDPNNYLTVSDEVQEQLDTITDSDEYNTELVAAQYKQWWNKAISDSYEPGSVFKSLRWQRPWMKGSSIQTTRFTVPVPWTCSDERRL
jgi:stage V sporulation protein D (sporulation-specific penicillin-binding protein)